MKRMLVSLGVFASTLGLVSTVTLADGVATNKALTVETAAKAIVGVWNGTEKPCEGAILSFDGEGRITEEGFNADGMLLGCEPNRQGKIKYRLEANTNGAGIVILRIDELGKHIPMHLIEAFEGENVMMRALKGSLHSEDSQQVVKWHRIQAEPFKVKVKEPAATPGSR